MLVFTCCVGALMMGAVGMGGVVILPALLVAGIDVGPAIVSIYLAVMPASLMKLLVLGRTPGVIPWKAALSCGCTAAIGAAVGGVLVESAPRRVLTFLVGAVAALAGARAGAAFSLFFPLRFTPRALAVARLKPITAEL